MNGQQRASPYNNNKDYSRINMVKSIVELKDYRGYDRILFLRPFSNTYIGYLDNDFFGFTVPEGDVAKWGMEVRDAVDHYLDKLFFHNPVLEFNTFFSKPMYRGYVNALKLKFDKYGNKTKV